MKKTIVTLPEIKLIGITTRTNNTAESESSTAKIAPIVHKYYLNGLSNNIPNRIKPGITYSVYTNYISDFTEDYTYLIGEESYSLNTLSPDFTKLTIPEQTYAKFTVGPGPIAELCIYSWQKIWQMDNLKLGGKRRYHADFEIYDERASDPKKAIFDIYVGIKK